MSKGTSLAEAMSNSEKIKPVALAIIVLRLSEGTSHLLRQSVEISVESFKSRHSVESFKKKIRSNVLKAFRVNLKVCLSLVLSNQYCSIIVWEN